MNTKLRVFETHENGDLLIRFQFDWSSVDLELISKFGDPYVNVGGSFLAPAVITPTITDGVITGVVLSSPGVVGSYSTYTPPEVVVTDPGGLGQNATFTVTMGVGNSVGTITNVTVDTGGTGYHANTTLKLSNSKETIYPESNVRLLSGFPYTRRINTIEAADPSLKILADNYIALIEGRVADALAALRAIPSANRDLTRETVYQP